MKKEFTGPRSHRSWETLPYSTVTGGIFPQREAHHSPPSSARVQNECSCISTPSNAFMPCILLGLQELRFIPWLYKAAQSEYACRSIWRALRIRNLSTRCRWVVCLRTRPPYPSGKRHVFSFGSRLGGPQSPRMREPSPNSACTVWTMQIEVRKCLLSFRAESFVFQVAIQKFKD